MIARHLLPLTRFEPLTGPLHVRPIQVEGSVTTRTEADRRAVDDDWDASAYILRGQHCPKSIIRTTLTSVGSTLGADRILHVAFDNRTVIGGLCFAVGFSPQLGVRIETLITRGAYRSTNKNLIAICGEAAFQAGGVTAFLPNPVVREIANVVAFLRLRHHSLRDQERREFLGQISSGMYLTNTGSPNSPASPQAIQSIILLSGVAKSPRLLQHSNLLNELSVQLKSTPEAASLSDQIIMAQVAERLHSQTEAGEPRPFGNFASDALDLALDVTNSQGGAVYTISGEPTTSFTLIASRGVLPFPQRLTHERPGALAAVVAQNRALQVHRWPLPMIRRTRTNNTPAGTVLLTPIGGPGGDPGRPAIGALIIFRQAPADAFSAYDLALARNVALRIALARTTDVMARIGEVTTRLRTGTDWSALTANLQSNVHENPLMLAYENTLTFSNAALPTDVKVVATLVTPALKEIAELTDSHSVSLRLALPIASVDQQHGLALVRVASYPSPPWKEQLAVITEDKGGCNWECMRSGRPVYAPRVADRENYVQVRDRTNSELSMPVRVEGLLVGTMNLESTLPDAYNPIRPLIASFAGAVGRTLGDARALLEQRAIDGAAQALNHKHSMERRLDDLNEKIMQHCTDGDLLRIFELSINRIRQELTAMRRVVVPEEEANSTLGVVLQEAVRDVDFLEDVPTMGIDPGTDTILSALIRGYQCRALRIAIANILSNLANHTAPSPNDSGGRPLTDIRVSESFLQGENQIVLSFLNYSDSYLDAERIANLYRCPIEDNDGRLRVGAFLAGLNARRSRARLYSAVFPDFKTLRTTLVIPVESRVRLCWSLIRIVYS